MITLGSKVKDRFTGFQGIATGRAEFVFGCSRIQVEPEELKDGKPIEPQWFDEQRIEVVQTQKDTAAPKPSGGPQNDPVRSSSRP